MCMDTRFFSRLFFMEGGGVSEIFSVRLNQQLVVYNRNDMCVGRDRIWKV